MQYIFGDNRSSYAIIHTDTTEQEAKKLNSLIRFAITPNEKFNILGYLTYGTNSSNAMFFRIKKDTSIPRSCYYTHAFNRELGHEYYSKKNFEYDMFAQFVEQEEYDALRDGAKNDCEITFDTELLARAQSVSVIDSVVLREVIASLYQKKKVLLAIDDEKYCDELVRVVIRQIFEYLTPSLKKAVSYLSAVVDTGNADVMLRIVPKSMLADVREAYLDIDGGILPNTDNNIFYKLAECLIGEEGPTWRGRLFKNYEVLFHGKDSVYKKQNMEELFWTYIDTDRTRIERIVDNFLSVSDVTSMDDVTNHAKNNLLPIFTQEEELERRFVFKPEDILDPAALFEENEIFIYKALLYSNIIDQFLCERISRACIDLVITKNNVRTVEAAIKAVLAKRTAEDLNVPEQYFFNKILAPIFTNILIARYKACVELINKSVELIGAKISPLDPIEPSEEAMLKQRIISDCAALAASFGDRVKNIDIADLIEESIDDKMFKHNKDYMEGTREGMEGIKKFPNEIVLQKLAAIDQSLKDGTSFATIREMAEQSLDFQEKYYFMVDDLLALYIIKEYKDGNHDEIRSFIDANFEAEDGFEYLVDKIAQFDTATALSFVLDNYRSTDKAARKVISSIVNGEEYIDKMSEYELEAYAATLFGAFERFVGSSSEKKDALIKKLGAAVKDTQKKGNGNVCKLLCAICAFVKTGKTKKKIILDKSLFTIIISALGGVAVVFMVLSILFMTGVFGTTQQNTADDTDEPSTSASADDSDGAQDSEGDSAEA